MALSSPAFAEQNASHSAALFRQAAGSAFWQAHGHLGYNDFLVTPQSTPNMSVNVAAGQAWVQGSSVGLITGIGVGQQGSYYALSDAPVTLTIANANASLPRIDVVYLRILDTNYGDASNGAILGVVTGTAASSPAVPALPANCLDLAHVRVNAGVSSIGSADISFVPRDGGSAVDIQQSAVAGSSVLLVTEATLPSASARNPAMGQLALAADTYNMWLYFGGGNWGWAGNVNGNTSCTVYQTLAQTSLSASTFHVIPCDTAQAGNGALADGIGITVPTYGAGVWLVSGLVSTKNVSAAAEMAVYIFINGNAAIACDGDDQYIGAIGAMSPRLSAGSRVVNLSDGDKLTLVAVSGATFDTNVGSTATSWLSAVKIGGGGRAAA